MICQRDKLRVTLSSRLGSVKPPEPTSTWNTEPGPVGADGKIGKCGAILGYVVAEAGVFKDGRGRFDENSLREIQRLWPAGGATAHSEHPNQILTDGLLQFIGRSVEPRRSLTLAVGSDGTRGAVPCIRANLIFDSSARLSPFGDLPKYFLERVRNDPASLSSSLVLATDIDNSSSWQHDGAALWTPEEIYSSDLVSVGAAVGALLGAATDCENWLLNRADSKLKLASTQRQARESRPAEIRGFCYSTEPVLNAETQTWEIISECDCSGAPVLDRDGNLLGRGGENFALCESGNSVSGVLTTKAAINGQCRFVPDFRVVKRDWHPLDRPGHELHGHKIDHIHVVSDRFVLEK